MEVGFGPGTIVLGKYRTESVLGRGGMGVVLRVTHLQLGEELAIKVLLPEATSPEGRARFLREAQSVVRLRGEHVTRVIDVGILPEGAPYMVMELLRGLDLADELRRRVAFAPGEAVDYALQACEALAEAHAYGIIHRDIKPGNLFLTKRPDGTPLVKVLDFGISKSPIGARDEQMTRPNTVMGTPGYMSPEQMKAANDVDARSDIWAIGIVLYEFLTGRRPFDAEAYSAVVLMAANDPPPAMDRRIPRGLQAAVLRCLEKQREARFPSIAELAAALSPFARDQRMAALIVDRTRAMARGASIAVEHSRGPSQPPTATTLSTGASQVIPRRRSPAIIGTTLVLVVIGGLTAAVVTSSRPSAPPIAGLAIEQPARPLDVDAPPIAEPDRAAPAAAKDPPPSAAVAKPAPIVATPTALTVTPTEPDVPGRRAELERDQRAKVEDCERHKAEKRWQALEDCAAELERLDAADAASAFRITARRERANEHGARQLRDALRASNLKSAQAWLSKIDTDSVYFAALGDELTRAEVAQVEAAERKAQGYAKAQNCTQLEQYITELGATTTPRVIAAAQAVAEHCKQSQVRVGPVAAAPPPAASNKPLVNNAPRSGDKSAPARSSSTGPAASSKLTAGGDPPASSAPTASGPADPAAEVKAPRVGVVADVSISGSAPPPSGSQATSAPPPAPAACEAKNVDQLINQAMAQYSAGYAKSALALALRALACRQDSRILRFVVTYACAAQDLAIAKQYFVRIAAQYQPNVEQKCQQEGLNVRGP